jgi:hypothetical protein
VDAGRPQPRGRTGEGGSGTRPDWGGGPLTYPHQTGPGATEPEWSAAEGWNLALGGVADLDAEGGELVAQRV